jgi:outer membrane lipoprotein-sorting protein
MSDLKKISSISRKAGGLFLFLVVLSAGVRARSVHNAWTLPRVLQRMDKAARSFRTLTAHVQRTKVTVVVNAKSTESGTLYVDRDGKMRLDLDKPDRRTVLRSGDHLYVYNPLIKQVDEYDLAKHREIVDQFLLLGFGTPARELKKAYVIGFGGQRTLDGQKTILLDLTPKSEAVRNQISEIQLWISESNWFPVRQKFQEAGTPDYFTIRYSDIERNAKLKKSLFKPDWPKGTHKVRP